MRFNNPKPNSTWRDYLKVIKAAREELRQNSSIMTEYERLTAQNEIQELKQAYSEAVTKGLLTDHENALNKFRNAHIRTLDAKKNEAAGWDAQKLNAEMQTYTMLIDQAVNTPSGVFDGMGKGAQLLEKTYNEALKSGDKYKARAIAEVLKSAPAKFKPADQETKNMIDHLARQAERDMVEIRTSAEIKQTAQEAQSAYQEYLTARENMIKEVQEFGEQDPQHPFSNGPFTQALKRVQADKQGMIHIYDADAPEVTGVYPMKEVQSEQ